MLRKNQELAAAEGEEGEEKLTFYSPGGHRFANPQPVGSAYPNSECRTSNPEICYDNFLLWVTSSTVELRTLNPSVAGSNPSSPIAFKLKALI